MRTRTHTRLQRRTSLTVSGAEPAADWSAVLNAPGDLLAVTDPGGAPFTRAD
ncbi:hypothetical protein [Streptomyces sp. NPDC002845]